MNKLKYLLITGLYVIPANVLAASPRGSEAELTKPVGGDILPGGQVFQEDIKGSIIFSKILPFAITWTINLAIALAVVAIIIGGYQFMTSYGDTEKRQKAQKTITYAVIGLILAITAFAIVQVITTIQFTPPAE
jgi:hypothetical protein